MDRARAARSVLVSFLLVGAVTLVGRFNQSHVESQSPAGGNASSAREQAYRANNVGVALLEQFDYQGAAQAFRSALQIDPAVSIARLNLAIARYYGGDMDGAAGDAQAAVTRSPESPHAHYVLGLVAKVQNRLDEAAAAFTRVLQLDPGDVGSQVQLGQIDLQQRRYGEAIAWFRKAVAIEPYNVTATYNLGVALTRAGERDEGKRVMDRFEALRATPYGTTFSQTYLEQGRYAEAIASTGAETELVDPAVPDVSFVDRTAVVLPDRIEAQPEGGAITLFDQDGDGDLDLFQLGGEIQRFYRNDAGVFHDATAQVALSPTTRTGTRIGVVAGDIDNDGKPDLFVFGPDGHVLYRQTEKGTFRDITRSSALPPYNYSPRSAAFLDADHDGDLDIVVAGVGDSSSSLQLWRNNGHGAFAEVAGAAGLAGAANHPIAVVPTDYDNRRDIDLLVANERGAPGLFRNERDGSFRDVAREVGLAEMGHPSAVAAADFNKDGWTDFFFGSADGPGVFATSDGRGRFVSASGPDGARAARAVQFVDYDNDGLLDLFVLSQEGPCVLRNVASRWVDVSDRAISATFRSLHVSQGATPALALGDLDGDGDADAVAQIPGLGLRAWRNEGGSRNRSLRVRLIGRVSNRSGIGAKVELRAGSLRQKIETFATSPAVAPADILFGLGARPSADAVRVLWPAGILQAETALSELSARQPRGSTTVVSVTELDRKPSSCPYLYTWNGSRFEFVTDFLGGGEMGYWVAPGLRNVPDPSEYVRIRDDQLRPRDGHYEVRLTNELEEVLFLDRAELAVVTHPEGVEVFPNEGLVSTPRPPFTLYATKGARPPNSAVDDHGHDVLAALRAVDRRYVDDFDLERVGGYARSHNLTLDLGPASGGRNLLLLTGWTDYAFSSDNVAAHQAGLRLQPPALQVKDASGRWRTVIPEIGIPVGRPQTIVVDMTARFLSSSREVRIVTTMRIHWDQILVDDSDGGFPLELTRLDPVAARLRWRGFSAETSPDGREPFAYDYQRVARTSPWKLMTGRYTREGDVRPLLKGIDDMFVVSRPGDEIAVSFPALLPPPAGWTRTFLLYVDGFSKEMNLHSSSPDHVAPLPFHGMSGYPYTPPETYPTSAAHRAYLERYNTRVVSRQIPALEVDAPSASPVRRRHSANFGGR